jgi:hypothetical protein
MTDEQISEIYSLGRESFFGGQSAFQVQAYPFRMTPQNMAKYRDNPNMPFWRMIKEGNDIFEVTKTEPKVDVCERKYVFDAEPMPGGKPLSFNPTGKCPAYQLNPEVAQALQQKEREDNSKLAELIARGTPLAKSRAGIDGGMHPVFATKLPDSQSIAMSDVNDYTVPATAPAPGTIPPYVNPPKAPESSVFDTPAAVSTDSTDSKLTSSPAATGSSSGGFFSSLAKKVGLAKDEPEQATAVPAAKPAPAPKSKPIPKTMQTAKSSDTKSSSTQAAAPRVISLDRTAQAQPSVPPPQAPAPQQSMAGAQPAPSSDSFSSRWSTMQ